MLQKIFTLSCSLLALAWPLIIFAALHFGVWQQVLPVLALILLLRHLLQRRRAQSETERQKQRSALRRTGLILSVLMLLLCLGDSLCSSPELILWYPVAVNLLLLAVFFRSLYAGSTVVEDLARISDPNLPHEGVAYTRRVTRAWCIFFTANGLTAAATVLSGSLELWTLWNGLLSYICIGLMMAGEYLIRRRVMKDVRPRPAAEEKAR